MRRNFFRLFMIPSLGFVIAIGVLVSYLAPQSPSSASAHRVDPVKEIAGYRNWARVNPEPQLMPDQVSALCAAPIPVKADDPANPHRHKYITVYVNDTGRKAMLEEKKPAFPEGSVIVKEKLSEKSSPTPELLTVMIKRGKDFNPGSGNWEYMVVDGTATIISAQGKLENCQSCHSARPDTDYIFRTYLPGAVRSKLK